MFGVVEVRLALEGNVNKLTSGLRRYISRLISRLEVDILYLTSAQILISAALALVRVPRPNYAYRAAPY